MRPSLAIRSSWLLRTVPASAAPERTAATTASCVPAKRSDAKSLADLGEEVAPGLHEAELRYLVREEWAREAADVVWRRTKLGLRLSAADVARVEDWLRAKG